MINGFESPGPNPFVIGEIVLGFDSWCEYLRGAFGPLPRLAPLVLPHVVLP
jgi:hypothetical protein